MSLLFWGLYYYNRELVFPARHDATVSWWYNHQKHSLIVVWSLGEAALVHHALPPRTKGVLCAAALAVVYLVAVFWVWAVGGVWAYPVLGVLGLPGRTLFCGACVGVYVLLYRAGLRVTQFFYQDTRVAAH